MRFSLLSLLVILGTLSTLKLTEGRLKGQKYGGFEDKAATKDDTKPAGLDSRIKSGKEGKKSWIMDPKSDLCQSLTCDKMELCLLEDEFTAVCVKKTELQDDRNVIVQRGNDVIQKKETTREYDDDSDYYIEDDDDDDDDEDDDDDGDEEGDSFLPKTGYNKEEMSRTFAKVKARPVKICSPCPVSRPIFLCGSDNRTYSSLCRLDYHNCINEKKVSGMCKGFCPCKGSKLELKKKAWEIQKSPNEESVKEIEIDKVDRLSSGKKIDNRSPSIMYSGLGKWNKKVSSSKHRVHNDVIDSKSIIRRRGCTKEDLISIGGRLVDWFSVIRRDVKKTASQHHMKEPFQCKSEVKWMFDYLNSNGDDFLSLEELARIENGRIEECIGTFIKACDFDKNDRMNPSEWCKCFDTVNRSNIPADREDLLDDEDNGESSGEMPSTFE